MVLATILWITGAIAITVLAIIGVLAVVTVIVLYRRMDDGDEYEVSITCDEEAQNIVEELQVFLREKNPEDVFQHGLAVLNVIRKHVENGHRIIVIEGGISDEGEVTVVSEISLSAWSESQSKSLH